MADIADRFVDWFTDLAHENGWAVHRITKTEHVRTGYPLVTLVRGGMIYFVWPLRDKGRFNRGAMRSVWLSRMQEAFKMSPGCIASIWRPCDWAEIEAALTKPIRRFDGDGFVKQTIT